MIKIGTGLKVSDNSGAKKAICLKIYGCKQTSANIGDLILISVRALRNCRKGLIRVKKGELHKALIIRTKINRQSLNYSTRLTMPTTMESRRSSPPTTVSASSPAAWKAKSASGGSGLRHRYSSHHSRSTAAV